MASTQQYAYLSEQVYKEPNVNASYTNRPDKPEFIAPDGHKYWIIARASNANTGYQGTIYQDQNTGEIIVAHRGTEPSDRKDLQADGQMVASRSNMQIPDARALVAQAQQYAINYQDRKHLPQLPQISVTGHSLGGSLAEITAAEYGVHGCTFNSYGTGNLHDIRIKGHPNVVNHVIATDAVSAAAPHIGTVKEYARPDDITTLYVAGYGPYNPLPNSPKVMAIASASMSHPIKFFAGNESVLRDPHALARAQDNHRTIHEYRQEVQGNRTIISETLEAMDTFNHKSRDAMDQLNRLIHDHPAQQNSFDKSYDDPSNVKGIFEFGYNETTPNVKNLVSSENPHASNPMLQALLQNPAFTTLPPEQQATLIAGAGGQVSNLVTPSFDAPNINNATAGSVNEPIDLPPRVASLHAQITEKFGDQIAHLSEKDQQTTIALATREAMSFYARTVDYVFVNQQGDVCISFDGDKGFSGDVNLNQVHHQDANQILLASIDRQQDQLQELSMQRAQSQNQSPAMSI